MVEVLLVIQTVVVVIVVRAVIGKVIVVIGIVIGIDPTVLVEVIGVADAEAVVG